MIASVSVHVNPNLPWYIARSSGIVAWALVTASVIWGLAFSGKLTRHPKLPSPAWMLDLHRFLGGMAVVFTGFHIAGLMMDKFVGYGPAQIAVPFTGVYRPVATAWGIIGCYLLLSIELTSLVMARLPRKVWHGIHLTSFGVFTLVTVHGLSTGTDARHGILPLSMVLAALVVAMLTGMRAQIAIAKRTERAARAQRAGRAAPGPRPVRQPAVAMDDDAPVERPVRTDRPRPVRQPAVAMDEVAAAAAHPPRPRADDPEAPARPRPARQPAAAQAGDPYARPPAGDRPDRPAVTVDDEPMVRPRPAAAGRPVSRPGVERATRPGVPRPRYDDGPPRPMVPAAEYGAPTAPPFERDDRFRPPTPEFPPEPYGPPPGPYADPRYYGDPRFAPPPYADPRYYGDPRFAPGPYADPRMAAGPPPDPRYGGGAGVEPRIAAGALPAPTPPAPMAVPPAATLPSAFAVRTGPAFDDDVEDAEIVEDQAEAVGEYSGRPTGPTPPAKGAAVYPLHAVSGGRPVRPRPHLASGDRPQPADKPGGLNGPPPPYRRPSPAGPVPSIHRVAADGRGADPRPSPVERPMAADGRGAVSRRMSADGRPVDEPDMPAERVAGRLP